jgi:hypothetical protein
MAITNRERIDKGLEQVRLGLTPFVERELKAHLTNDWVSRIEQGLKRLDKDSKGNPEWDTYTLFKVMWDQWNTTFKEVLGQTERNYVSELINVRNDHAHEKTFGYEDTERYLDTMRRLLMAVNASDKAELVSTLRKELIRVQQAEETRRETRKVQAMSGTPQAGLKPWREVITPHDDVAMGRYMEAEFAADLDQVHGGKATAEYADPKEFFARTFLTDGLKELLSIGARRLTGKQADPVVELQTNFGGGKTHSMLALYHLFSGAKPTDLPGLEELLSDLEIKTLPKANRAVLVGVNFSPAESRKKEDGTEVRTMWGEMAWQLGGRKAFDLVAKSDKAGTSPGKEVLVELLTSCSPCLILIDEWVALLRQLPDEDGLAAGSFGSNITFAQALTEAVKGAPQALVVASLPQSSIEVGGTRGERALKDLSNVIKRIAKPWRPASTNEGFEIVRRRLFKSTIDFPGRDAVVKAFSEYYREQVGEFPLDCRELEYSKRMTASYPIHPELFQQFEQAWATLEKFQRTRGILRLMAAVIHELWQRDDRNLMIMPSSVTLDSPRVMSLITECLPDGAQWEAVISKDIDGSGSRPVQIDTENPNLGRYSAARRVARTIFMGSAPTISANSPGLDENRLRLGCAQPGETLATFDSALRRLTDRSVYLYVDNGRYWYMLKATVAQLARERAEQLKGSAEVSAEILKRLRLESDKGEFAGIHVVSDEDDRVEDLPDTRLVILGPKWSHSRRAGEGNAQKTVDSILMPPVGTRTRVYQNSLVFLAADLTRLSELKESIAQYLSWKKIREEADQGILDISQFSKSQAKTKTEEHERACKVRLTEAWSWVFVPSKKDPTDKETEWNPFQVTAGDSLAPKVSRKLVEQESLLPVLGAPRLKLELDRYLWADQDHVNLKHVADCFASYLYFPRLARRDVLIKAVQGAFTGSFLCEHFGYATGWDEDQKRYTGLQTTNLNTSVQIDGSSLLVKPSFATAQAEADAAAARVKESTTGGDTTGWGSTLPSGGITTTGGGGAVPTAKKTRFYGTMDLPPQTASLKFSDIQTEIIQHFTSKLGTRVSIKVDIVAENGEGFDASTIRTVSENSRVIGLSNSEFSE